MKPSEIAQRLDVLNADLALSGRDTDALACAQASAYLIEYEGVVYKLDHAGAALAVTRKTCDTLRNDLSRAEGRIIALEAEIAYYQSRLRQVGTRGGL